LASGLRVVSQETYTYMSAIGAVVEAGSAMEWPSTQGAALLTEALAWSGSLKRSQAEMLRSFDEMGGYLHCNAQREQILYCVDVLRERADDATELLAETMLLPDYKSGGLDAKELLAMSRESQTQDQRVKEMILTAAYGRDSALGAPLYSEHASVDDAARFRADWFTPKNIVLAGTGIDHSDLVSFAETYFEPYLPPPNSANAADKEKQEKKSSSLSAYRPGIVTEEAALPDVPGFAKEAEEKVRVAVAAEADWGWHSPDLVVLSVLQTLLGGGDSFSAGGPGKGMYSRLYRETLNSYHWIDAAEAFCVVHQGTSLLGISGSCKPIDAAALTELFVLELRRLKDTPVSLEELDRAKNMLKNNVLTQLESRLVLFEDLARQFATFGRRQPLHQMVSLIDAVTQDDIMRLGSNLCTQPPAVAAHGPDLSKIPDHKHLAELLLDGPDGLSTASRFRFFPSTRAASVVAQEQRKTKNTTTSE